MFKIVFVFDTVAGTYKIDVRDYGYSADKSAELCQRAIEIMASHFLHGKPNREGIN